MLHFMAKDNALKCMDVCLRQSFQRDPKGYLEVVNAKTNEDDTPLLLACQYKSNEVIKLILDYGGVDIAAINSKKQVAYQVALASGN